MQAGREADTWLCVVVGFGFRVYGYRQAGSHLVMREAVRGHELLVVDRPLDGAHLRLRVHLECSSACKLVRERERERVGTGTHEKEKEGGRMVCCTCVHPRNHPLRLTYHPHLPDHQCKHTHKQTQTHTSFKQLPLEVFHKQILRSAVPPCPIIHKRSA